ncbi:MAG: hypothetical protein WC058_09555 [Phycisphaeraceae bacterium]
MRNTLEGSPVKWVALGCLWLSMLSMEGCFYSTGPDIPSDWIGRRAALAMLDDPKDHGRLEIIACYSPPLFSHAALRLVCPDRPVIFWDPGGDYAKDKGPGGRAHDLISDPPTLSRYLSYREMLDDTGGEIFQWDIPPDVALRLHNTLTSGNPLGTPGGAFTTSAVGLQCSLSISDFLRRFAPDILTIDDDYFYPFSLAQHLWTQHPHRVLVYRRDIPLMIYLPPVRPDTHTLPGG